jgi:hypothetical protein
MHHEETCTRLCSQSPKSLFPPVGVGVIALQPLAPLPGGSSEPAHLARCRPEPVLSVAPTFWQRDCRSKRDGLCHERDRAGGGSSGRSHLLANPALQIHFVFNEIDSLEDGFTANRESTDCVRDVTKYPLSRFLSGFFIVISFFCSFSFCRCLHPIPSC